MAVTEVNVSNFALAHLGVGKQIAALTEDSAEAQACNLFFEVARDEMLRDFVWPFAKRDVALGLVTASTNANHPTTEWKFSYRYPSDCLFLRKIQSSIRTDARLSRVSYEFAADLQGTLIYTDMEDAVAEYTSTLGQQTGRWSPDFTLALSYRLASYIAPLVTAGDPFKVGQASMQFWQMSIRKARATAGNEVQPDLEPDGELILARS